MRISHKHKFVFFSKPKSASTSIRVFLNNYSDIKHSEFKNIKNVKSPKNPFYCHIPPCEAEEWFVKKGWNLDQYNCFTTVRNPYSRIVSVYKYATESNYMKKDWNSLYLVLKDYTFEDFIKNIIIKKEFRNYPDVKWLYYSLNDHFTFIEGLQSPNINIKTFKIEDGIDNITNYLKEINIPINSSLVQNQNISTNKKPYQDYYNNELKGLMEDHYKKEIEYFNYKF